MRTQRWNKKRGFVSRTLVVFYKDREGNVPVLEWLDALPAKIQDKGVVKIERLRELGHELRRPEADLLRNGIYEPRVGREGMNYRILYSFRDEWRRCWPMASSNSGKSRPKILSGLWNENGFSSKTQKGTPRGKDEHGKSRNKGVGSLFWNINLCQPRLRAAGHGSRVCEEGVICQVVRSCLSYMPDLK
jgi:hypothetical protein